LTQIEIHQATDKGGVRADNQDAIGTWAVEDGVVFAVADGMGGVAGGKLASELALDGLGSALAELPGQWPMAKRLRTAISDANLRIFQKGMVVPELRGLGTTLTATSIVGSTLVAAHVGDCRLFLLRDGELRQLTKDHSWVGEQMQLGLLSAESARRHPRRHLLTRSLGRELILAIDFVNLQVRPGDVFLQCSDGVHAFIPQTELLEILQENDAEAGCRELIARGLAAGGDDNLSAQVAVVTSCPTEPPRERGLWWPLRRFRA
jgi:PPM family protein phosphatase